MSLKFTSILLGFALWVSAARLADAQLNFTSLQRVVDAEDTPSAFGMEDQEVTSSSAGIFNQSVTNGSTFEETIYGPRYITTSSTADQFSDIESNFISGQMSGSMSGQVTGADGLIAARSSSSCYVTGYLTVDQPTLVNVSVVIEADNNSQLGAARSQFEASIGDVSPSIENAPGTYSSSGILEPGQNYWIYIQLLQAQTVQDVDLGFQSANSEMTFQITATTVPEPALACSLVLSATLLLLLRRRKLRHIV